MSKPSIRTGTRSRPSASCSEDEGLDPLLAAVLPAQLVLGERELRVLLGQLAQPAQVAARGDPHLDLRVALAARAPRRARSVRSFSSGPTITLPGTAGAAP